MTRRRVVCACSRESEAVTDADRRAAGWRLVQAQDAAYADVFVWMCPACDGERIAVLRARVASALGA